MFCTASMAVSIEWSWLLYLCMPFRPTVCRFGDRIDEAARTIVEVAAVRRVVDRVRLRHAHHGAVDDVRPRRQPELLQLLGRQRDEVVVGLVQSPSPSKQKYSMPRQVVPGSGTIARLQLLKFWIRPTFTPGVWM